jgi:DNA-binding NarL/FixJ family response regulator
MGAGGRCHGGTVIRVLLVEGQTLVSEGLETLLNLAEGIRVVARAADGIEAIQRMQKHDLDLVLMDVRMPEMSGIEVLREMKAKTLPVPTILF